MAALALLAAGANESAGDESDLVEAQVDTRASASHSTPEFRTRPGTATGQIYNYNDDQGLNVLTLAARATQPLSSRVEVQLQGLVDRITLSRPQTVSTDPGAGFTGHSHAAVDVVTSASVSVTGGSKLEKTRLEGIAGVSYDVPANDAPTRLEASARVSSEEDYHSYSGRISSTSEFFQRNTTLNGFVGYGHDIISPLEPPPGQIDQWPASHSRVNGGFSLTQNLTPRFFVTGGVAVNYQFGTLESPYRRALVRTTLFPEALPEHRTRVTAFGGVHWYLGWGSALHLREGFYGDDWGVRAFIPEAAWLKEIGQDWLISANYRFYWQTPASFFERTYNDIEPILTGDVRLGPLHEHHPGFDIQWQAVGEAGDFGSLSLQAGSSVSILEYRQLVDSQVTALLLRAGIQGFY